MKFFTAAIISLIIASASLPGCSEFIEESVEDEKVVLLAPGDSSESGNYNQKFWWEPVKNALYYRLQIVTPSFDSIGSLAIDTLVKADKFEFTLEPGRYEWRVRAENGSSQSLYTARSFTIRESTIENQQVQLKSPANHLTTNNAELTYAWNALFGASVYRLQIDTNNFADESVLFFDNTTSNLEFTVPFTADKQYQWRVRAEADSIQSRWSTIQQVTFDKTPPEQVILTTPANKGAASSPVAFRWNTLSDAKQYEFTLLKSDSTTVYNTTFPVRVNTASYTFSDGELNEVIYWKVRAVDAAGNWGPFSEVRSVTIQ